MSRILRRPMFRGGRVDSRGTGIASGLGYAKGGQIGGGSIAGKAYADGRYGFENPRFTNLGGGSGTTGKSVMDAATSKWSKAKDIFKSPKFSERGLLEAIKKYGPKALNWGKAGIMGGLSRFPGFAQLGAYYGLATPTPVDEKYGITRMENLLPMVGDTEATMMKKLKRNEEESSNPNNPWRYDFWTHGPAEDHPDYDAEQRSWWPWAEGAAATGKEEKELSEEEKRILALQKEKEDLIKSLEDALKPKESKELTEEEELAEIEKKKKMFQKAYGSGRVDDASTMALSFASKALKEGATVKSAFGEFFEDESKRPSESKKYKDAATTAAINAYLTGQTSYQKFKDDIDLYKDKMGIQTKAAQDVEKNKSFAQIWSEDREQSTTKKNKNSANRWLANQKINKFVNETNSKKVPTEDLFVKENIGEYFVDQQTGEFFLIDVLENGEIGKVRKG